MAGSTCTCAANQEAFPDASRRTQSHLQPHLFCVHKGLTVSRRGECHTCITLYLLQNQPFSSSQPQGVMAGRRICISVDASPVSREALSWAASHVIKEGDSVVLVTVMEPSVKSELAHGVDRMRGLTPGRVHVSAHPTPGAP